MGNQKKEEEDDLNDLNKVPNKNENIPIYDFFNMQEFSMLLTNSYDQVDEKMVKPSWINDQNAWNFLVSLEKSNRYMTSCITSTVPTGINGIKTKKLKNFLLNGKANVKEQQTFVNYYSLKL